MAFLKKEKQLAQTQFTPTGGELSAQEIKAGYWFVSHKLLLRRIGIIALAVFDIIIVLFALYAFADYYLIGRPGVQGMYDQITSPRLDYQYLFEIARPQQLQINFTESLKSVDNKYDLVAEVFNSNSSWTAEQITYHFENNEFSTEQKTDFILPLQTKYLMVLNAESEQGLSSVNLVIDDILWQKVTDYDKLSAKILDIEIVDPQFQAPQQSGVSEELSVSRLLFTAKNNSAYNFWDVNMKVLLYRGSNLIYIDNVFYESFDAGEVKNNDLSIFKRLATPDKIYVIPDINILNPAVFKGFDGEGEVK